jgi:hypothetical protein
MKQYDALELAYTYPTIDTKTAWAVGQVDAFMTRRDESKPACMDV